MPVPFFRAHNSAVECHLHTVEVVGSNPTAPTISFGSFVAAATQDFACGLRRPQPGSSSNPTAPELMVYHTEPGKVPALESVFKDVSKLQAKHGLKTVGYWVPNDDSGAWKDTFVYLIAHPSQEDAQKNWDALHADPAFLPYRQAAIPLIKQMNGVFEVEEVFMRPTDFSAMQ